MTTKADKKAAKTLLETARKRWDRAYDADKDNRTLAVDDMKFLHEPGAQWDEVVKKERGDRPCYEFNKLRISVKRVINDIRANRPQGKVRAVEDGDKPTSSVLEGLCRNIWNVSDGDAAIDAAAEYIVGGGMGAWRVNTRYSTDDAWDQDIVIEQIRNPMALWADPNSKDPMKRDAEFWFLESRISKDAYEQKYGKVEAVEWEGSEFDDEEEWEDDDRVRIAEYWYKKPITKTIYLLATGESVEDVTNIPPEMVLRSREVKTHQICMAIISGDKVLEGPTEWAGTKFPFVQVYGEYVVIDGKIKWWGLARHAKDSQRMHNAMLTNALETAALSPQAKWWATAGQAQGLVGQWAEAHKKNMPFLLYNPDPLAPGAPQQMNGAQLPAAFTNLAMFTSEEIKATTGIFDASLGNKSNETTGIAIRQRQAQGEIANFNFSDNMARGIRYTWELLLDLIPKIYDTPRTIRVIGSDGAEDYQQINGVDAMGQPVNDISRGKYDVTVTVGPSFSTQRQEAAEVYSAFAQANPAILQVGGDLIFKSLDLPYADEMAERMQVMLPPPVQQQIQAKKQQGGKMDPAAMAAMAQAEQAMQQVQMHGQMVEQAAQEAEVVKTDAEKAKAEVEKALAALQVQQAQMEAEYEKRVADIMKREAQLVLKDASLTAQQTQAGVDDKSKEVESERQKIGTDLAEALADMKQQLADFQAQAAQTILQIQANTTASAAPKRKSVRVRRVNGELIGEVEEQ